MIILLTFCFSLFLTPGDSLFKIGFLNATVQGLKTGLYMVMRLSYLIIGSSLMTLTTTPNQLTDGLEKGLGCLNRVHVPVHEVAMMMSIALRFIPILLEEMDRIKKAQQARGADFESGNLIQRAKGLVPLLVPLFIAAIRRANDLAMAMEARCYHGGQGIFPVRNIFVCVKNRHLSKGMHPGIRPASACHIGFLPKKIFYGFLKC